MARPYTLKKRAAQQAETRQRIVEAAVDLHGTVGPSRTTVTKIAERAGVQRHTLYAHFPDERSLFLACSGLATERDPMPDPTPWQAIADRNERLETGLAAIYAWFERNESLTGCVLRDSETHALTLEMAELRTAPTIAGYHAVLGASLAPRQQAMLTLALDFHTWRSLVRDSGMATTDAASLMAGAIAQAG
ncbi:MAG: helix-turn-helix domain-containing protein [Bauldia litoralis]